MGASPTCMPRSLRGVGSWPSLCRFCRTWLSSLTGWRLPAGLARAGLAELSDPAGLLPPASQVRGARPGAGALLTHHSGTRRAGSRARCCRARTVAGTFPPRSLYPENNRKPETFSRVHCCWGLPSRQRRSHHPKCCPLRTKNPPKGSHRWGRRPVARG